MEQVDNTVQWTDKSSASLYGEPCEFQASNLFRIEQHTLFASADLTAPTGMVIKGVILHGRDAKRWVTIPDRKFIRGNGTEGTYPVIDFINQSAWRAFTRAAVEAIEKLIAEQEGK